MAKGMPSMVALLGLLAVAGYQHRDKLAEMLKGGSGGGRLGASNAGSSGGGLLGGLADMLRGDDGPNALSGGLGELLDRFKSNGQSEVADSWLKPGPNRQLTPSDVARVVGEDNLAELSARVGLSREELLQRLATNIPEGVDSLTPDGHVPSFEEARSVFTPSRA